MTREDEDAERARRWLAAAGVTRVSSDAWRQDDSPEAVLTPNEVAHTWTSVALEDPALDATARLRTAFGLLDLLGEYWVTMEIRLALADQHHPLPTEAFWAACRLRLEAAAEPEALLYSLWVDWFEDRDTAATAFAEVLGRDLAWRPAHEVAAGPDRGPWLRRARRVLEVSGPVPWPVKQPAYRTAAGISELHPALFRGLLGSYHDVHGDLEPEAAVALLKQLDLPAGTEHLTKLHQVLEAGHRNHYLAPHAWR
ncbi:hypothetical protein ABZ851_20260 [Streptomyces sp. NPDC047049]|uniref:hypothetical protein n=1 Tax=Streptomyces sp. NPDC047049 TaxID=3156688 RepID=UPI0033E88049